MRAARSRASRLRPATAGLVNDRHTGATRVLRQGKGFGVPQNDQEHASGSCCPQWCVVEHDPARGEDDWLHASAPLDVTSRVAALLTMSVDPVTGHRDGPWVMVGEDEFSPGQVRHLGRALSELATRACEPTGHHAAG